MGQQNHPSRRAMHVRRSMGHQGMLASAILATHPELETEFDSQMRGSLCGRHIHHHGDCKSNCRYLFLLRVSSQSFHGPKAMAALMLINRIFSFILLFGAAHSATTGRHPPRINNATRHSIILSQILYSTLQVMS